MYTWLKIQALVMIRLSGHILKRNENESAVSRQMEEEMRKNAIK